MIPRQCRDRDRYRVLFTLNDPESFGPYHLCVCEECTLVQRAKASLSRGCGCQSCTETRSLVRELKKLHPAGTKIYFAPSPTWPLGLTVEIDDAR